MYDLLLLYGSSWTLFCLILVQRFYRLLYMPYALCPNPLLIKLRHGEVPADPSSIFDPTITSSRSPCVNVGAPLPCLVAGMTRGAEEGGPGTRAHRTGVSQGIGAGLLHASPATHHPEPLLSIAGGISFVKGDDALCVPLHILAHVFAIPLEGLRADRVLEHTQWL